MNSDSFAYIRERMKILDLVGYNMELHPADDKNVLMWMPEHATMPIFIEMMSMGGYNVRQAYAYNERELEGLSDVLNARTDYVIDYDGTYPGEGRANVITCKSKGNCLANRRVFKPFLNSEAEMLCIIDLLQAQLDLLFNGVNVVIDGYNERAVALGRYLRDRACSVSFDTVDSIDRLELMLSGVRVASSRAYSNADMLFVACDDKELSTKLAKLKDECIVINVAGRYAVERLYDIFTQLAPSTKTLDSLYTRARSGSGKLHLMFSGDDAAAKAFRYMTYEAVDMIYSGCAMSIDAIESGTPLDEASFDARIARIKLSLFVE